MEAEGLRLAVLTNMVPPYRRPLFEALGERFDLHVVLSGREDNRAFWADALDSGDRFCVHRVPGLQVHLPRRRAGANIDCQRIHWSFGLLRRLSEIRPDAIISAEMGPRSVAAILHGRRSGVPVWIWWGGTLHTEASVGAARGLLRRWIVRASPRWISYGQSSTHYLLFLGVPSDRILTVQNTVDGERFTTEGPATFAFQPKPAILTVGGLVPRKGLRQLVASANRLWRSGLVFSLIVAGDGPQKEALRRAVDPKFGDRANFLGPVDAAAMPGLYRSADGFILPTLEDVWGLAVNEAILSGLPVACSTFAGCAWELLSPEAIFDPLQPESIDESLRKLVEGRLAAPERSRIWSIRQVADAIIEEIVRVARPQERAGTTPPTP
ncbi:MAG: glycosyltransferase [Fimbriimonadales bacterium]|nr:glycosyltransferase [Fimbriimonadales bacterium]